MPSQTGSIDLTAQVSANNNAKDYSDNVVDNLVVGGRNLFVNGSASNGYPTDAAVGNTYGITNMSTNHEAYEKIPVEEDSSYVVQYWVDDSAHAGWVCIQLLDSSDVIKNKICRTYPAADYWTTTIDIPTGVSQMLVSGRHLASGYAYAKIKVEKGNKATDWTPAPEDQEAFSISSGVEYIEGTQSAATNLWTGVTKESSLVSGKTISYKLPFAGNNSAATLNLTLSDGSTTGAKAIKQIYTTASNTGALADVTTHWPVGSVIPMTYDGTRWIVQNYNTNVDHYDRIQHNNTLKSATEKATGKNYAIVASSLIGYISSLSGYQTILGGSIVDISKPLLWGTGNVNVSTTFTNAYEIYPSQTVRNNAGGSWTGTTFSMVYLFGTLNGTNLTVDSTVFTCTIPITEHGKVYIPIGILYSEYQIGFRTTSDIYAYKDGEFGKLSLREASAASKTATNYISADANGISIHMANESNTYQRQTSNSTTFYVGGKKRSEVGADGLKVYVGANETEMASFGASTRIGKAYVEGATDNESHLELDFHSMRMVDKEGREYFEIEDLRERDGTASITDTFTGDGINTSFSFTLLATDTNYSVNVSDSSGGTVTKYNDHVKFSTSPTNGSTITVTYLTTSEEVKAYTFGFRFDGKVGPFSVVEGSLNIASGKYTHAEGSGTKAVGESSHAEGRDSQAKGYISHAEGYGSIANGPYSHAEGFQSNAYSYSHSEGNNTEAFGIASHAEGYHTKTINGLSSTPQGAHAEGYYSEAREGAAHAEGMYTLATERGSHAEGYYSEANALYAHAQNFRTLAGYYSQTVIGKCNSNQSDTAFEIGNGTSNDARSNAATIDWNGNYIGQAMAGIIQMFAGATPPTGWLVCDGSAISRTTYATLFAAIGTTWGSGDGSTTFNVPDLRGRMPMGAGTGSGLTARTLGNTLGAETHNHGGNSGEVTLSAAQSGLPAHTHSFTQPTVKTELLFQKNVASGSAVNRVAGSNLSNPDTTTTYTATVTGGAVGAVTGGAKNASSAHKHTISSNANIPPSAVVNFIICTGKTS